MRPLGRCRRDANEPEIVAALRAAGATVEHIEMPGDLLVGYDGLTFLLEVKAPGKKLSKSQVLFATQWHGHYTVVRTAAEALEAVGLC